MPDSPKLPTLAECYVDYTCGTFKAGSSKKHLNALIGNAPDGSIVVRKQYLKDETEVGFTVHLRSPDKNYIEPQQVEHLKNQIDKSLKKHGLSHGAAIITNPADDHIEADNKFQDSLNITGGHPQRATPVKQRTAAYQHYDNQVDIVYKVPSAQLDRLAQAVAELEKMKPKRQGKSR